MKPASTTSSTPCASSVAISASSNACAIGERLVIDDDAPACRRRRRARGQGRPGDCSTTHAITPGASAPRPRHRAAPADWCRCPRRGRRRFMAQPRAATARRRRAARACRRRVRASRRAARRSSRLPRRGTTMIMPRPMLNVRRISSLGDAGASRSACMIGGTSHVVGSSSTASVSSAKIRGGFSTSPPPVMCAAAFHGTPRERA